MVIALDAARESAFVHFPSLPQGFAVWKPYGVGSVRDEALRQQLAQYKSETYDGESSPRVGQAVEVRLRSGVWAAGFIVPGPMGDSNVFLPDAGTAQLVSASRIFPVGDGSGTCPFFTPDEVYWRGKTLGSSAATSSDVPLLLGLAWSSFARWQLRPEPVEADCSSLFRAWSLLMYGSDEHFRRCRAMASSWMLANRTFYQPLVVDFHLSDAAASAAFDVYTMALKEETTWPLDCVLQALYEAYHVWNVEGPDDPPEFGVALFVRCPSGGVKQVRMINVFVEAGSDYGVSQCICLLYEGRGVYVPLKGTFKGSQMPGREDETLESWEAFAVAAAAQGDRWKSERRAFLLAPRAEEVLDAWHSPV